MIAKNECRREPVQELSVIFGEAPGFGVDALRDEGLNRGRPRFGCLCREGLGRLAKTAKRLGAADIVYPSRAVLVANLSLHFLEYTRARRSNFVSLSLDPKGSSGGSSPCAPTILFSKTRRRARVAIIFLLSWRLPKDCGGRRSSAETPHATGGRAVKARLWQLSPTESMQKTQHPDHIPACLAERRNSAILIHHSRTRIVRRDHPL